MRAQTTSRRGRMKWWLVMSLRLSAILAAAALSACGTASTPDVARASCDRVAAPGGSDRADGTTGAPFRTVQRLAGSLEPGETGCLRAGTYDKRQDGGYVLKVKEGGRRGKPLTIQSYPGERAKLEGVVYVTKEAPNVTLRDVDIDGRARWLRDDTVSVQVMAANVTLEGNRITNRGLKSCVILGSNNGYGRAVRPVLRRNVFHRCGDTGHGLLDHGIYVENAVDGEITENVFWGTAGYAVHLYPNAQRMKVARNVMDDNGGGVIVAGNDEHTSSGNVIERNVIARSRKDHNIALYWEEGVGRGNVARDNCLFDGDGGDVDDDRGLQLLDNVSRNPRFVDAGARDYRLESGSPCADILGANVASAAGASRGA